MASEDQQFVRKTNEFALMLAKQVLVGEKKNVVISPFSISNCLSFAAMGAGGATAEEMFSVLKYGDVSEKNSVASSYGRIMAALDHNKSLNIANKVYVMENYSVKQNFHDLATKHFRSEAESVNFSENAAAAKKINNWVESKTNDKIKDLISADSLDDSTRMVLVNAIHFKGTWTYQFDSQNTRPMPFWKTPTESVQVPMMNIKKHFNYCVLDEFEMAALELTYSDSDVSMLILLPNERDGLSKLESKLESLNIADIRSKMHNTEVEVFLPKFKIEFDLELKDTLEKLGMGTMFTDRADFSELLEQPEPLKVSKVVHKAFIEVNEEGTEAAAATAAVMRMKRAARFPIQFNVDGPFYYLIQMHNQLLFIGKLKEPDHKRIQLREEL